MNGCGSVGGSETFCEIWIQPKQIEFAMIFIKSEYRLTCAGFYWLKSVLYFKKEREFRTRLCFKIGSGFFWTAGISIEPFEENEISPELKN
jgi:hypothetical protein